MCTEFIISPVSNGWMVSIPSLGFNDYDPTGGMLKALPRMFKKMQDPEAEDLEPEADKSPMLRNKSVFVFSSIEEVLAFLAKQITDK